MDQYTEIEDLYRLEMFLSEDLLSRIHAANQTYPSLAKCNVERFVFYAIKYALANLEGDQNLSGS